MLGTIAASDFGAVLLSALKGVTFLSVQPASAKNMVNPITKTSALAMGRTKRDTNRGLKVFSASANLPEAESWMSLEKGMVVIQKWGTWHVENTALGKGHDYIANPKTA